jgi:hypothetical protein
MYKYSKIVLYIFFLTSFIQGLIYARWNKGEILRYDAAGYYYYIPAIFLYSDITGKAHYETLFEKYKFADERYAVGIDTILSTGNLINKYPIGVAFAELPMFLILHPIVQSGLINAPPDGYSNPYRFAVFLSAIFCATFALFFISRVLIHFFSDIVAAFTLVIIGFGTNFWAYATIDSGMGHIFNAFYIALLMFLCFKWYKNPTRVLSIGIGLILGVIIVARPTNILLSIIPISVFIQKIVCLKRVDKTLLIQLFLSIFSTSIILLLQMSYWKLVTGNWVYYSYKNETFDFFQPNIVNGLFSFRKGLLLYTPLFVIGIIGWFMMFKKNKWLGGLNLFFWLLFIYITFSWYCWYYGWSFSGRPFVDVYPVLALSIAFVVKHVNECSKKIKMFFVLLVSLCIWLNIYQTNQYAIGTLPGDGMTKERYLEIWNRLHI